MPSFEVEAMFLKMKNGDTWQKSTEMHSKFWKLKGWTDIHHQTMCVEVWGLLDSMNYTQVVSSIRVTCFYEIHTSSALRTNVYYSH
jgi:hypothetical protein